jgi:anti-sigma-K factor RskA
MTLDPTVHPYDDLAVYALDALDADERTATEAHLAGCPLCRAELDRHLETLAYLTPRDEAPPPTVWEGIARQLPRTRPARPAASDRPTSSPFAGPSADPGSLPIPPPDATVIPFDRDRPHHARRSAPSPGNGRRALTPWLAAAAVAVIVLGIAALTLRPGEDPDLAETAAAAAADESSTVVQLATATGDPEARVVRDADGHGYVLLDDLPQLPEGRAYQLWRTNDTDTPVSLGMIGNGDNDAAAVSIPSDATGFAISDEPASGSPTPGSIVAIGDHPA